MSKQATSALADALRAAGRKAVDGGAAGAAAQVFNVGALIWLRTTVNYQYRHGKGSAEAMRFLYNDGGRGLGGVLRFYRGIGPALLQAPLARFGDTAANAGTLALLDSLEATQSLPVWAKTGAASVAAGSFRIVLMPLDALKTVLQVEGKHGAALLRAKIAASGPRVLWAGALGSASATLVGHYPWFLVYNELNAALPVYDRKKELASYLARNAAIGFCASAVSDTLSNSIRVLKTTKQSSATAISYAEAAKMVVAADGVQGLFFRGLRTKILANGAQGMLFSVLWRMGQDYLDARAKAQDAA